jgi:histidinol dehydrogenase
MRRFVDPSPAEWEDLLARPQQGASDIENVVHNILQHVHDRGDAAVREFEKAHGHLGDGPLRVAEQEITTAGAQLSAELREAIGVAVDNIRRFHAAQAEEVTEIETIPGVRCWRKSIPIERVGLYVPGGTAPLFSSLLMLGVPAKLAGCSGIAVCSPTGMNGKVHATVLYCADLLGIREVYGIGGAQAIAAMAFGTATIKRVHKIFGPGNRYVDTAKRMVSQRGTAIDLLAGPSEVAVVADESSDPGRVAADLLSQAEHGADSQVVLVSTSSKLANAVDIELEQQLVGLPRAQMARKALENGASIVVRDMDTAMQVVNAYAPEHLVLACANARAVAETVVNAGSVFIGSYSCESAGDYASGTNHALPTGGHARSMSGVSLDSFVRKTTFQELTAEGLRTLAPTIETMALAEGLQAHAQAVRMRWQEP